MKTIENIDQYINDILKEESQDLENSRLAVPLNSAYKSVASSIAVIGTLSPKQRKEASLKLIDIVEVALGAIDKTLHRSGSTDANTLTQLKTLIKKVESFDEMFSALPITSPKTESLDLDNSESGEQLWNTESGTPGEFDEDYNDVTSIEPLAVRILKNNADIPKEAAEGDPAEDLDPPKGSEGSEETVDDKAENELIDTLAAETTKAEESGDEDVPKQFKGLPRSETDESQIHKNPSHNLELLSLLMNKNI